MIAYFIRRIILIIPTFIGITMICFLLTQFIPGGPVEQMLTKMRGIGEASGVSAGKVNTISADYREQLEKHFGFDQPLHRRYLNWLIRDRIGMRMTSYKYTNKTAWDLIRNRMPVSLIFGLTGFFLSYLVCIPLGIVKALKNGSRFDFISSVTVFIGYAIPPFALGMVLKMFFCGTVDHLWDVFPVAGFHSEQFATLPLRDKISDLFMHMLLPCICYMAGHFAVLTLLMKNSLMDQIGRDYIRTIVAAGGTARRAIWGHALRNALIPIATGFGSILSVILAGSVIIEQVFEIPGMGLLSMDAIVGRDYAVFMAILSISSILALLGNILSDFCYVLIDPRIDFSR
ncbi:MAG: ABC transporter permease subunit [Spartobacteria bacterium]|nr:ABC transporter permease subunit [Spartobacteria bacterium]